GSTVGSIEAFNLPDSLAIVPSRSFVASGPLAGPFSPSCTTYLVTNRSSNTISWSVSGVPAWLNLSVSGGTVAGHSATVLNACIAASASGLPPAVYQGSLIFSNVTTGLSQARHV